MEPLRNKIGVAILITAFLSHSTYAADIATGLTLSKDLTTARSGSGSEFISGDYPGAVLIRLNLWGAVGKPGIHFVPAQTDLITLLSYAGGPLESAKLNDVAIKRWSHGKEQLLFVNAEDILRNTDQESPVLQANDIIIVPQKKPLVNQDTAALIGLISSVLSLVALSFVLVNK